MGDWWDNSDASYTGDTGESVFSLQYYRNKANEFQAVLSAMDAAAQSAWTVATSDIDPQLVQDMLQALDEYNAKRWELELAVDAINLAASALNAMDIRFPVLSMPSGLGAAPLVIPVASVAAVAAATAAAATLIVWGRGWIDGVNQRQKAALMLDAVEDPVKRAELAAEIARTDAAAAAASGGWSSDLLGVAKWAALGLLGVLALGAMR